MFNTFGVPFRYGIEMERSHFVQKQLQKRDKEVRMQTLMGTQIWVWAGLAHGLAACWSGTATGLPGAPGELTVTLCPPASAGHLGAGLCELVTWSEPSLESLPCTQTRYWSTREEETERDGDKSDT